MMSMSSDSPPPSTALIERVLAETRALRQQIAAVHESLAARRPAMADARGSVAQAGAPLYATCFGVFRLYRAAAPVPLGQHKAVIQLGRYLVAHAGQLVPRDVLLDLLWPEADRARALHRLHVAVSVLRGLVDPPAAADSLVRLDDDRYSIDGDAVLTDCDLFDQRYRLGTLALHQADYDAAAMAFRSLADVYAGEFLADDRYAEWTQSRRAHFRERHLDALTFLCEHAMRRRDLLAAVDCAQQILAADNLRERAHRHLMRAHYLLGQRACAMRQYHLCAAILQQELGVLPSLPTQHLFQAIARDTPLPDESPMHL